MKIVIVGGVAGGASTAARLRRNSETAEIIMFEKGPEISYANCGIPYHIGQVIKERDELVVVDPAYFKAVLNVDVRVNTEVTGIDPVQKTITAKELLTGKTYSVPYDALVLSPGGTPIVPPISGINDKRIFTVRNLTDMDKIKTYIATEKPRRALVIGAGFIGLEMAENLHHLGLSVGIIEQSEQVLGVVDFEIAASIHQHLKTQHIGLYLKDGVTSFSSGSKLTATLKSGKTIETDLVIMSIGVRPDTVLAKQAGLTLGELGGIKVNEHLQTSDKNIYALGDAIEITDSVCDCPALIPLANSANKQGRIVADMILGKTRSYTGTPGTAIAKVFDLSVATTGSSEKRLKKLNLPYSKVYLMPSSHAGYYPEAFPLTMKMLYSTTDRRVLGAQIVGVAGVDKRIDVVASIIQQKQTVDTLAGLELAYAPPYSSAKDPVNLAGMIAINQLEGKNPVIFWDEVSLHKNALFVDVRTPLEYDLRHIPEAINIPLVQLRHKLEALPKDKEIVFYCNQGKTGYFAVVMAKNLGFTNVKNLSGGMKLYHPTTLPQDNTSELEQTYIDKQEDIHMTALPKGTVHHLNACGLQCPGPIMQLAKVMKESAVGDTIEIVATDQGFTNDAKAWCESTGNELLSLNSEKGKITALIQKGKTVAQPACTAGTDKTMVVFSNDLDKAIATFIIANGAASMGRKVTLFFTFWGLNILRKPHAVKVKKGLLDIMFGIMMPRGSKELTLSKMHMGGMGGQMIRWVMKNKNIDSLEALIAQAQASGVRMVACQMSMDVMGIKPEELIAGVEIGGVAQYLNAAEKSDTNLFI